MVVGVGGGTGTSTVAAALGGVDAGVFTGQPADVVVCRASGESVVRASAATRLITARGGRAPVLAVTCGARAPGRAVASRLRLLAPHTSRIVSLPYVRRWAEIDAPLDEAGVLPSAIHAGAAPRHLRPYWRAVTDLHTALDSRAAAPAPRHSPVPSHSPAAIRPTAGRVAPHGPGRTR